MPKRVLKKYDGKKQKWLHDIIELLLIFLVVFLLFHFVVGISFVKGTSMYPTLHNNELAFYTRIVPHFEHGDVLSVKMPSGEYYVKRVVAIGGDTVDIKDGKLYINGEEMDEPYISGKTEKKTGGVQFPYTVEDGKVFVMGDNREGSMDSRDFGAVVRKQIKGKVWIYIGRII
ncbi:MAG: signal peptidase I [Muricomes sp.]